MELGVSGGKRGAEVVKSDIGKDVGPCCRGVVEVFEGEGIRGGCWNGEGFRELLADVWVEIAEDVLEGGGRVVDFGGEGLGLGCDVVRGRRGEAKEVSQCVREW